MPYLDYEGPPISEGGLHRSVSHLGKVPNIEEQCIERPGQR